MVYSVMLNISYYIIVYYNTLDYVILIIYINNMSYCV